MRNPIGTGSFLRRVALLSTFSATMACSAESSRAAHEEVRPDLPDRVIREVAWDTLFRLGGTLQDTLLQGPSRIAAYAGGAYVADHFAGRLLRLDREGRVLWTWGNRGGGPDELQHPRHLVVDDEHRIWILDIENARVAVVGSDGTRQASLPLDRLEAHPEAIVPREGAGILVVTADRERPFVIIDEDGHVVDRQPFPWPGFRGLPPLASQARLAYHAKTDRWVTAFTMADGFFPFTGLRWSGVRGWYVEPVSTSRVVVERRRSGEREQTISRVEEPHFAAADVALTGDRLLILFQGSTRMANRVVDMYAFTTGEYLESLLLPTHVSSFAYADSVFYGIVEDPYPAVVAWRARPAALPSPTSVTGR